MRYRNESERTNGSRPNYIFRFVSTFNRNFSFSVHFLPHLTKKIKVFISPQSTTNYTTISRIPRAFVVAGEEKVHQLQGIDEGWKRQNEKEKLEKCLKIELFLLWFMRKLNFFLLVSFFSGARKSLFKSFQHFFAVIERSPPTAISIWTMAWWWTKVTPAWGDGYCDEGKAENSKNPKYSEFITHNQEKKEKFHIFTTEKNIFSILDRRSIWYFQSWFDFFLF